MIATAHRVSSSRPETASPCCAPFTDGGYAGESSKLSSAERAIGQSKSSSDPIVQRALRRSHADGPSNVASPGSAAAAVSPRLRGNYRKLNRPPLLCLRSAHDGEARKSLTSIATLRVASNLTGTPACERAMGAKIEAARKKALADPAVRAKRSAATKAALADPAVRAKMRGKRKTK